MILKKKQEPTQDFTNIWSYHPNARFGIFRKVLISFLIISLTPIILLGLYFLNTLTAVGDEMAEKTTATVNRKIQDGLELQAVLTAKSLQVFLEQCEQDLIQIRDIEPSAGKYIQFSRRHNREIWKRSGTNKNPGELRLQIPLYKEISFVDAGGMEQIKIVNNRVVPRPMLKNVNHPQNTTYKVETYFQQTKNLKKNEIYVSHLVGFHVNKKEQLGQAKRVEDTVEGKEYDGVIRMAAPVYKNGRFQGVVVLGLDHRHLMEFTQHILPNQKMTTVFPSYMSGNYAFMFDDRGWIITHPKYWDIPGVDSTGKWVPAYTKHSSPQAIELGNIPFNLDSAAFIHKNYPFVSQQVRSGLSGSVITTNVGGVTKIMAYAPILYNKGEFKKTGVFGGITVGAELKKFQLPAFFIGNSILQALQLVRENLIAILVFALLLSIGLSWLISRGITNPILIIMRGARELAKGKLEKNISISRNDEIGVLAAVFNFMAYELQKSRSELLRSYNKLKQSKAEVVTYAEDLEYQLKILKSIQRISNILGSTLDMNAVIRIILQNCVESVGFDRALLYLLDEKEEYLECKEAFGFTDEEDRLARQSKYHIQHFDCIETRVAREGRIVFISDFKNYRQATALDKRIRRYGKSNSFVFIPLKVKERIIGILGADKLRTADEITQTDINSLQILANQAARVIENTRLYSEIINQRNFVEDVLRYMINGVLTVNTEGVITSINRSALSILSVSKANILGKNAMDVFRNSREIVEQIREKLASRGFYHGYNLRFVINEVEKYININASTTGGGESSIVILEDVTERKRLDENFARVERLASLGRFAAGLAHELRNPLTGVSLLLDDLHDKLTGLPEVAQMLAMALNEIERLENLTNEILDYANPTKGSYKEQDINELIESTLPFIEKQCRQTGISVQKTLQPSLPPVRINADKIRQALLNILINAIQAMPGGGRLSVKTHLRETTTDREDQPFRWIRIIISDDGPGIPSEDYEKIFEPFFTKNTEGTGLGLSTTQSIVVEHGGKIKIKSSSKGTSFIILLQVHQSEKGQDEV